MSIMRLSRSLIYSLLAFLLIAGILELGTYFLLSRTVAFKPYQAFYSSEKARPAAILAVSYPVIDSLLGWSNPLRFEQYYSDSIPESERSDGSIASNEKSASKSTAKKPLKLVALGGSTTDPQNEKKNWVFRLTEECSKSKLLCHTLNGGNSGYTSTQELLKLERDVIPLRPDLVISLNGINDESMSYFDGVSFTTPYHRDLMGFLASALKDTRSPLYSPPVLSGLLPNTRFLFRLLAFSVKNAKSNPASINAGTRDNFSRASRWEHNIRMMHAISAEFGSRYFVVLQPHLGLNPEEMRKKHQEMGITHFFHPESVLEFYKEARAACAKLPYCLDLSRDFPLRSELYKDPMHLLPVGHAIEAERIFSFLRKNRAL